MALSIRECVAAKNGGYMPRRRPARRTGLMGFFGLGAGPWDSYSYQASFENCIPSLKNKALVQASSIVGAIKQADAAITRSQNQLQGLRQQVETLAAENPNDLEVQQLVQDVAFAGEKGETLRRQLEQTFNGLQSLINSVPSNQCPLAPPLESGSKFMQDAQNIANQAGRLIGDLRDRSLAVGMAAQQRRKAQEQAEYTQAQQVNTELERIRLEQQAEAERFEREQKAIEAQRRYEQELRDREQARLDALEADRQARLQAEEARLQAAQQREADFQNQMLLLEQQRQEAELQFRREQAEREAARQQRMEEQEALMQQLLFMQELGVRPGAPQGVPGASPFGPAPYPFAQQPALPFAVPTPGSPNLPGPAGFVTPGTPQGPAQLFQAQLAPQGFPGAMPAMQPLPSWQQSVGIQAQQQAPPGMQFASFNPGVELFGMGAYQGHNVYRQHQHQHMGHYGQNVYQAARGGGRTQRPFSGSGLGAADQPVNNPTLKGALIETGYAVFGPSEDANGRAYYTFESPSRKSWTVFADKVIGPRARPVLDPNTQRIIYAPPPGGQPVEEPTDWRSIQEGIQSAIQTGVQAYQGVAVGREQAKLVRQQRREERAAGAAMPDQIALSTRPSAMPGWVAPVALVGVVGAVAVFLRGSKKK